MCVNFVKIIGINRLQTRLKLEGRSTIMKVRGQNYKFVKVKGKIGNLSKLEDQKYNLA
jgi:hypothetical protein